MTRHLLTGYTCRQLSSAVSAPRCSVAGDLFDKSHGFYLKALQKPRAFGLSLSGDSMTAGASQCPSCPVCVRDSSIWPGRKKGAADTVKRKRRGKTPGEVAATVAKKTAKEAKARKDKARKEKAARSALVATLRKDREKDGGEGPSIGAHGSHCWTIHRRE